MTGSAVVRTCVRALDRSPSILPTRCSVALAAALLAALTGFIGPAAALGSHQQSPGASARPAGGAGLEMPTQLDYAPIQIQAGEGNRWRQGAYDVWHLRGQFQLRQGQTVARAEEAVLWVDRAEPFSGQATKIIAYLEGDVVASYGRDGRPHRETGDPADSLHGQTWLGRFYTTNAVDVQVPLAGAEPAKKPAVFERGLKAFRPSEGEAGSVQPAQFAQEVPRTGGATLALGTRRIVIRGRTTVRPQIRFFPSPDGRESIGVVTGGINILIEGLETPELGDLGPVDIETDSAVIWTSNLQQLNLMEGAAVSNDIPVEIYMEGHIVFRQGDRVIYADRMYYNVNQEHGTVLSAEVLTPVPEFEGLMRLKADVLQQIDHQTFVAYGAAATSSRMGVPRYWFQSQQIVFQDNQVPLIDVVTGQPAIDPVQGRPIMERRPQATSFNNVVYMGGFPVFYWPVLSTDLKRPSFYIDNVAIRNDNIFGTQVLIDWDVYQLLGIQQIPEGTDWTLSTDYLSDRGFALGTALHYDREGAWFLPGRNRGFVDAWGLRDRGLDNLGFDRRALVPEKEWRGRLRTRHRHDLPYGLQFTSELGWISDRNFLEQYFESEWDQEKDATTGFELKQHLGAQTWSISSQNRLNDFFTETEWWPRLEHFALGFSLFEHFTWHAHTHVGYAKLRTATRPEDPVDAAKFNPLPWEAEREGLHTATRQEISLPLELGPTKIVPYALGEVFYIGQDLEGDSVTRLFGQTGVRGNLPVWKAYPMIQSELLNLDGMVHKMNFTGEFLFAEANQDLDRYPIYEQLDDNAQQHFRRRFINDTFGGTPFVDDPLPREFDERFYALRSGLSRWVTSPSTEIADDLMFFRVGLDQRWQTRRGLPGAKRVVDWVSLDVGASIFPKPDRDNFGEEVGLLDYNFRWHVGDRLTLVSDGFTDFFHNGLRTFSAGGILSRPARGSLYLGVRSIEGPISSSILTSSVSYRMSEKWIGEGGTTLDFGPTGNVGTSLALTRIGESFLIRTGFTYDQGRNNVGASVSIEPRFLPRGRLGMIGGVRVPPAGAMGVE